MHSGVRLERPEPPHQYMRKWPCLGGLEVSDNAHKILMRLLPESWIGLAHSVSGGSSPIFFVSIGKFIDSSAGQE